MRFSQGDCVKDECWKREGTVCGKVEGIEMKTENGGMGETLLRHVCETLTHSCLNRDLGDCGSGIHPSSVEENGHILDHPLIS